MRDHVDEARHPARDRVDRAQRRSREERRLRAAAGDRQPVAHVGSGLARRERPEVPTQRDPLVQLREIGIEEELAQLRLADKHDSEQFLGIRLEVQQQPDLLEQLDREGLRLVENQHADAAGAMLRHEERVQLIDELALGLIRDRQLELAADPPQQLERGERRHERVRRRHVRPELGEKAAEQRRLPRADLAGDADEAARLVQAELQVRERLRVLGGEKEVARVRRQPKRLFA